MPSEEPGADIDPIEESLVKLAPEAGNAHPIYDAYFAYSDDAYPSGTPVNGRETAESSRAPRVARAVATGLRARSPSVGRYLDT